MSRKPCSNPRDSSRRETVRPRPCSCRGPMPRMVIPDQPAHGLIQVGLELHGVPIEAHEIAHQRSGFSGTNAGDGHKAPEQEAERKEWRGAPGGAGGWFHRVRHIGLPWTRPLSASFRTKPAKFMGSGISIPGEASHRWQDGGGLFLGPLGFVGFNESERKEPGHGPAAASAMDATAHVGESMKPVLHRLPEFLGGV